MTTQMTAESSTSDSTANTTATNSDSMSTSTTGSIPNNNTNNNIQSQEQPQSIPAITTLNTNFGPIRGTLLSPMPLNNFLPIVSPLNGTFPFNLESPSLELTTINNDNNQQNSSMFDLPIIQPISMIPTNNLNDINNNQMLIQNSIQLQQMGMNLNAMYMHNQSSQPQIQNFNNINNNTFNWNNVNLMNFNDNNNNNKLLQQLPSFELPPDIMNSNQVPNSNKKKRGRKRKIKIENNDDNDSDYKPMDEFVVHDIKPKKRRGRKPKTKSNAMFGVKMEKKEFNRLLHKTQKTALEPAYVGIRNEHGEIKISIPPINMVKYEVYGHACTERIEDILQPKKRTRYVRGLNDSDKKDRRREQNRNAAARSRARKNAMISKVIQLHQENLALRSHVSTTIYDLKQLEIEKQKLEEQLK